MPSSSQFRSSRRSQNNQIGRFTYERLEPRKLLAVIVADYVDDFSSSSVPANWQYLSNDTGAFGTPASYASMIYESWRYHPATADFPYLGATFAHSGPGTSQGEANDRFAIAAFTVSEAGNYEITDSLITRDGAFGDGIEVAVHINDQPVTQLLSLAPASSGNFDTDLGELAAGDTIYIGLGPDGPGNGSDAGNDGATWDFSISIDELPPPGEPDPVTVSVDLETQRYVGDVSALDRDKYFNIHDGGADQDVATFQSDYDVGLGRQFWGPLPYAKNQTGQVGVYPNTTPSTDQSVRPVEEGIVHTGHPRDALRYDTDLQAAADWVTTYYTTIVDEVPEFYEPINEPFVHAGDAEFQDAPSSDAMRLKMAQLYAAIGEAIDQTPALANINVVGYSSAWPSMELWDFGHWETRQKMFMDVAGEFIDAFSVHLYDGINVTGQNNRRSGSNSEAILDLIETYSHYKWDVVKPHALTEFGGIEQGYGDGYSDIKNAQSLRSINHLLFNFLERENDVLTSVPFITGKAEWYHEDGVCESYNPSLYRLEGANLADCSGGTYELTWKANFYELWEDVQGERGVINASDPDIQTQLFVDGNKAYVAVNNLADETHRVDLEFLNGLPGLQNVEIREMEIPISDALQPTYTETNQTTAPDSVTLDTGGTAVLVYEFDAPIDFSQTVRSEKYYSDTHLQSINANQPISFDFDSVQASSAGEAILRMSLSRKHDRSKAPQVTVNNIPVDVPDDWKGYDQANRDDFFGMIEIPVPIELLNSNNTVSVTFPDSGGRVSSMILAVEAVDTLAPEVLDVVVNGGGIQRSNVSTLDLTFAGLTNFAPDAFSVTQLSDASGLTGTAVDTSFTKQQFAGNTLVTLSFDSQTRNSGALIDGNYQLTVAATSVTSAGANTPMASDFVFGDAEDDKFFTFFGDSDGDRDSDLFDYIEFNQSYRSVAGNANFDSDLDFENNGNVNLFDYLEFRTRFQSALPFTSQPAPAALVAIPNSVSVTETVSEVNVESVDQFTATPASVHAETPPVTDESPVVSSAVAPLTDDQQIRSSTAPHNLSESSNIPSTADPQISVAEAAVERISQLPQASTPVISEPSTVANEAPSASSAVEPLADDQQTKNPTTPQTLSEPSNIPSETAPQVSVAEATVESNSQLPEASASIISEASSVANESPSTSSAVEPLADGQEVDAATAPVAPTESSESSSESSNIRSNTPFRIPSNRHTTPIKNRSRFFASALSPTFDSDYAVAGAEKKTRVSAENNRAAYSFDYVKFRKSFPTKNADLEYDPSRNHNSKTVSLSDYLESRKLRRSSRVSL